MSMDTHLVQAEQASPDALSHLADELYGRAMSLQPGGRIGEWRVGLRDGAAEFTLPEASTSGMVTRYEKWILTRTEEGARYVTREVQRPSYESEGFGATIRTSITYALDDETLPVSYTREIGRLQDNGNLVVSTTEPSVLGPLNPEAREVIRLELQKIVTPEAPRRRLKGVLGFLLGRGRPAV